MFWGLAVDAVCRWMAELQNTGGLKELNRMFAAERKAGSTMRYPDFLSARKLVMLEAIRAAGIAFPN
jgi:hypothetical protein